MALRGEFFEHPWVIGITGASGTVYARRLVSVIAEHYPKSSLEVILSEAALRVMQEEEGLCVSRGSHLKRKLFGEYASQVNLHNNKDIGANIASGSYMTSGMVIVPCSMATLGAIAHGISDNLVRRAADVTLKEKRTLILVPRETPLSSLHLENLLKLSKLGTQIVPAMPGFYLEPSTIQELVDMMVQRILDQMRLPVDLLGRWGDWKKETKKSPQVVTRVS